MCIVHRYLWIVYGLEWCGRAGEPTCQPSLLGIFMQGHCHATKNLFISIFLMHPSFLMYYQLLTTLMLNLVFRTTHSLPMTVYTMWHINHVFSHISHAPLAFVSTALSLIWRIGTSFFISFSFFIYRLYKHFKVTMISRHCSHGWSTFRELINWMIGLRGHIWVPSALVGGTGCINRKHLSSVNLQISHRASYKLVWGWKAKK